jgi:hypothetical protein
VRVGSAKAVLTSARIGLRISYGMRVRAHVGLSSGGGMVRCGTLSEVS